MPDNPCALRRALALTDLRAHLCALGMDATYARGVIADPATLARVAFTEDGTPGADLPALARALADAAPSYAFRDRATESAEDWARRRFAHSPSPLEA